MDWRDALEYLVNKFKLEVKTDTKRMHKSAILLSFLLTVAYLLVSSFSLLFNLAVFSKIMLISAFAYELVFLDLCRIYIQGWAEKLRFRRFVNILKDICLTLFLFITFIIVFVIVILPIPGAGSGLLSFLVGILLFLLPYAFFEEMLEFFHERFGERLFRIPGKKGSLVILALLFPALFGIASAQNETIFGMFESLQGLINGLSTIGHYISKFLEFTGNIKDFFGGIGLSNLQSNAVIIVTTLIGFYFFLRMLKWVVKWTIIFMVIWVALQVIGII